MMDMEAIYTYEGTYDINSLISGRELTGGLVALRWYLWYYLSGYVLSNIFLKIKIFAKINV